MGPQIVHLPDGQKFTVTPVFGGLFFKSHELTTHHHVFPIGWTVILNTKDTIVRPGSSADATGAADSGNNHRGNDDDILMGESRRPHVHSYTNPTLQGDNLFISSISNPSSTEFKPPASPTRQIAMMLWITLYWYFHQPEPLPYLTTEASRMTPDEGKPKGEWRINVKRDGVLRGRNLIPKLERMGLIATLDSAVGTSITDNGEGWTEMFVSKRMFWQIPGRLFLFTLQPNRSMSSFPGSPATSRPGSPSQGELTFGHHQKPSEGRPNSPYSSGSRLEHEGPPSAIPSTLATAPTFPTGPFFSSSHLPTYYPPAPLTYTITNGIRHPLRPKPPRMGEIFYARYIESLGQYLSFRVASLSPKPVPYTGPVGLKPIEHNYLLNLSDTSLLQMWLANQRVKSFWGEYVPDFLTNAMSARHSFPVIGMWDGVPFGYFEIYWVKEDVLGQHLGSDNGDWDRGLHLLIGEEWARGRVPYWLTSLLHWCWTADYRTMSLCTEPRIDNLRYDCNGNARVIIFKTNVELGLSNIFKQWALPRNAKYPSHTSNRGFCDYDERHGMGQQSKRKWS
jgi:N5-hydroxyornithine acetyltransferase